MRIAEATIVLFLSITSLSFAKSGDLEIYAETAQDGTVARRVFTNDQGLPHRAIYYYFKATSLAGVHQIKQPKDESEIAPHTIFLYSYEHGRETWMGVYTPDYILRRSLETKYDLAGRLQMRQWRDADGIVRYQIQYEDGRSISHIYYDDSGKRVIKVQGRIPDGIDPSSIEIIK